MTHHQMRMSAIPQRKQKVAPLLGGVGLLWMQLMWVHFSAFMLVYFFSLYQLTQSDESSDENPFAAFSVGKKKTNFRKK